jgi:hypothetical protein
MAEIKTNKDNLEKALGKTGKKEENNSPEMPREMEIGFHQGALNTLINERNEMVKVIQQIEHVMQAHIKRLEELGVKIRMGSDKQ